MLRGVFALCLLCTAVSGAELSEQCISKLNSIFQLKGYQSFKFSSVDFTKDASFENSAGDLKTKSSYSEYKKEDYLLRIHTSDNRPSNIVIRDTKSRIPRYISVFIEYDTSKKSIECTIKKIQEGMKVEDTYNSLGNYQGLYNSGCLRQLTCKDSKFAQAVQVFVTSFTAGAATTTLGDAATPELQNCLKTIFSYDKSVKKNYNCLNTGELSINDKACLLKLKEYINCKSKIENVTEYVNYFQTNFETLNAEEFRKMQKIQTTHSRSKIETATQ